MINKLNIVPYTFEHGRFIFSCQANYKILESDAEFVTLQGDAKNLEQDNLAFTGLINNTPVFSFIVMLLTLPTTKPFRVTGADVAKPSTLLYSTKRVLYLVNRSLPFKKL